MSLSKKFCRISIRRDYVSINAYVDLEALEGGALGDLEVDFDIREPDKNPPLMYSPKNNKGAEKVIDALIRYVEEEVRKNKTKD